MIDARMQDLRFTERETAAFLQRAARQWINPSVVRRLHERTEGWPAALRLAALVLRRRGDLKPSREDSPAIRSSFQEEMPAELLVHTPPEV